MRNDRRICGCFQPFLFIRPLSVCDLLILNTINWIIANIPDNNTGPHLQNDGKIGLYKTWLHAWLACVMRPIYLNDTLQCSESVVANYSLKVSESNKQEFSQVSIRGHTVFTYVSFLDSP